jgi:hypothetical protein
MDYDVATIGIGVSSKLLEEFDPARARDTGANPLLHLVHLGVA